MTNKNNNNCLILNFWCCRNYGAILTCYGIYLLTKKIGLNSKVIKFFPKNFFERNYENSFTQDFANKYMELTPQVQTDNDFIELNNFANIFIAGSDQIWNPKIARTHHENVSDGIYQLDFVSNENKKIAFSASFGVDYFNGEDEEKEKFAQRIKKIDAISVREDTGIKILQNDFNTPATQIIDGAFLIPQTKLEELTITNETEKYIGCFTLPYYKDKIWYLNHLEKISKKYGLPIKQLSFDQTTPVEEWLSFIKNSQLIISDSYHAIVFSIIFNKPFIQLQNALAQSRFESLYKLLNINPIVLSEESKNPDFSEIINNNWDKVNEKIKQEVQKAEIWLINSIK